MGQQKLQMVEENLCGKVIEKSLCAFGGKWKVKMRQKKAEKK